MQHADRAVNAARSRVAGIDRSDLIAPVGDAVLTLSRAPEGAAALTANGARAARLLPPMLGADGPRNYLVAFQNLAEPRATGGIFGSCALIRTDRGTISIVDHGAASRTLG